MKLTRKLLIALLSAALLAGASASFANDGLSADPQVGNCRFIYDEHGNVIGYCCDDECIWA